MVALFFVHVPATMQPGGEKYMSGKMLNKSKKKAVKPVKIKGRGDYTPEILSLSDSSKRLEAKIDHLEKSINKKATVKSAASTVGRSLGALVGQGDLGALAGQGLAKLFGHGDYHIGSNSLIPNNKDFGPGIPKFSSTKRGTRIVEREYLGDIFSGTLSGSSTVFSNRSFDVTPTDTETFPWLSTIANLYDQWEPHGIVFEFVSSSSEYNGTSQALGTVIMATDYDATDVTYSSKQEMENSDFACSTKPSMTLLHGLECDPKERPLEIMYCESTTLQFSTLAEFQIATQGCSVAGVNLGELWISYDITFYKKQLTTPMSMTPFYNGGGTPVIGAGLLSGTLPSLTKSKNIVLDNTSAFSRFKFDTKISTGRFIISIHWSLYGGEPNTLILGSPDSERITLVAQVSSNRVTATAVCTIACFDVTGPAPIVAFSTKLLNNGTYRVNLQQVPSDFSF